MDLTNGNGSATEAGGVLTLSSTSPASCSWPTTAPRATKRFAQLAFDTVLKVETRCYGYTGTGNGGEWLALFKDTGSGNAYWIGWWATDAKIYVTRHNVANLASTAAVASPSTSPHTYRIYWNPTARPLLVEDVGASFVINPNQVQFWYRVGDAGTWTLLHSCTADFTLPLPSIGVFVSNVSSYPSINALFNYCGAYQWDAAKQIFLPANDQVPLTNVSVDPKVVATLEDQGQVLTQSGPVGYQWPDGQGDGLIFKPPAPVAFEDQGGLLTLSGPPIHSMPDGLDQGIDLRPPFAAFEDQVSWILSLEPEFSTITQDVDLHYHFVYPKPYLAIYCDTTNDPWNTPTLNSFTGYARNGYKYTNGVQDVGPVSAPWRSEASGANRSSRADFPLKSLIVATRLELVIFDLDTFNGSVSTLRVWMRFLLGNSASDFYALGRGLETIRSVAMANGQLVVGTTNTGWEIGRVHSVDFKALTPATVYSLCGSDNQWVGTSAKTVVDRNTNGIWAVSGSVRLICEENRSMSALVEGTNTLYVAISGEDASPEILKYVGGALQSSSPAAGDDIGASNLGNYRQVIFDDVGWLWFSIGSVLYRNCRDWREGYMYPQRTDVRQGQVDLGTTITHLVAAKDNIYAGTAYGVYRIPKGSMQAYLAYTVVGGGGRGRLNIAGTGEKLVGSTSTIQSLKSLTLLTGALVFSFLVVGTTFTGDTIGGLTLLRVFDDVVIQSYIVPNIIEPGTYISTAMLT
jgi:hypothetical protein